MTFGVNNLQM